MSEYLTHITILNKIHLYTKKNTFFPQKAKCLFNNSGIHKCVCPEDHAGDGLTCYGNILMVSNFLRIMYYLIKVKSLTLF